MSPITHEIEDSQLIDGGATISAMQEVINERIRQEAKWGQQDHPDLYGQFADVHRAHFAEEADEWKDANDLATALGHSDWTGILLEEVYEAVAESDPARLREELVQVAAVATAWIEAIDRRTA